MMPINPKVGKKRPLLKRDIEYAQSNTNSHRQASQYLQVNFTTYKRYAKAYNLYDTDFKNKSGRGVAKLRKKNAFGLNEILAGKRPGYDRTRLKERLIAAGMIDHSCRYCGFNKVRPDGRGPFVLTYTDDDSNNLQLNNLNLTCYNCYYLTTGNLRKDLLVAPESVTCINPEEHQLDSANIDWNDMADVYDSLVTPEDEEE
jgi:hypothetical protein